MIVVKGTREHAEALRKACREFLEGELKLTLNMEKTHITHVNDGFVFLIYFLWSKALHIWLPSWTGRLARSWSGAYSIL